MDEKNDLNSWIEYPLITLKETKSYSMQYAGPVTIKYPRPRMGKAIDAEIWVRATKDAIEAKQLTDHINAGVITVGK